MIPVDYNKAIIQPVHASWLEVKNIELNVLRLDAIHPVISGNKWFKLKYHLKEAALQGKNTLATFGGAWSNHIAATAYACKVAGLSCIGIIRGEAPAVYSSTLLQAQADGMQLHFVSREAYRSKESIMQQYQKQDYYWVNEGGFGETGTKGAAEILGLVEDAKTYTHIVAAVGTGTMLAGLINAAGAYQNIIGISSMKGNAQLLQDVQALTPNAVAKYAINHDHHFGGYGKHPKELLEYINQFYLSHHIPLDIVYTGKSMFATQHLVETGYIPAGSKLLFIHSGGLQGNQSLAPEVLAF
ncbi:1-aminocyclopropane-1-carboxylate deaminase/D-cysteine desulfhydrase [Aridibaculum aurantiacum]|uniref:1-aminocyclopropane-1-carboxylate deaminase/D-cysteine desulfhydrase n=1 Tax=Aridibaculum aurantiacum TaxID=2810307 RepID=UPI001A9598A7|nr:pyridoxal-phosphate dependent enzyme [Aridibaculum aurantiacum]